VKIVGVSFDSPEANRAFAEEEGFQYELWSDPERELALHYGAASSASQAWADRVTVLLHTDGSVMLTYPSVNVGIHPGQVLADATAIYGD
jgi:peroxiredoxin